MATKEAVAVEQKHGDLTWVKAKEIDHGNGAIQ